MLKPVQVSILIPMRNMEAFIVETLSTLLLENSLSIEILIVDDLSTDKSVQKIEALNDDRIRILQGAGQGISAALNLAISEAKGEVLMRCDADDLYPPGRIEMQFYWLKDNPEFGAVCGSFNAIDAKSRHVSSMPTGELKEEITNELLSAKTRTHFCSFAVRSEVMKSIGGFRPYFVTAEDIDFSLCLSGHTRVMYLPDLCYLYRLHNSSIIHSQASIQRIFYENTARLFQQQRVLRGHDDLELGTPPSAPKAEGVADKADEQIQGLLIATAWKAHASGNKLRALSLAWRSFKLNPLKFKYYRSSLALLLKPSKK